MIIKSILDADLYQFTQQQALLFGRRMGIAYSECSTTYEFINRGGTQFPEGFKEALQTQINMMADLSLSGEEEAFLRENCPFLKESYIDYLRGFRFNPYQTTVSQSGGVLKVSSGGPAPQAILWEVPLLAIISELYYRMTDRHPDDQTWERMSRKATRLGNAEVSVADFGTRRRFSRQIQDDLVSIFKKKCSSFVGTSNVHLAMKHGVKSIGTQAHLWFMFHAALFGYRLANYHALEAWVDEYQGDLGIALTDTFTTDVFFRDFNEKFALLFRGLRHDSGCPFEFGEKAIKHYKSLGVDPMFKTIVFSDSLDDEKACSIAEYFKGRINVSTPLLAIGDVSMGIGTFLSNDCGHDPLNMVIKMTSVEYEGRRYPTVKLSDVQGKHTGDPDEIQLCKKTLGLL